MSNKCTHCQSTEEDFKMHGSVPSLQARSWALRLFILLYREGRQEEVELGARGWTDQSWTLLTSFCSSLPLCPAAISSTLSTQCLPFGSEERHSTLLLIIKVVWRSPTNPLGACIYSKPTSCTLVYLAERNQVSSPVQPLILSGERQHAYFPHIKESIQFTPCTLWLLWTIFIQKECCVSLEKLSLGREGEVTWPNKKQNLYMGKERGTEVFPSPCVETLEKLKHNTAVTELTTVSLPPSLLSGVLHNLNISIHLADTSLFGREELLRINEVMPQTTAFNTLFSLIEAACFFSAAPLKMRYFLMVLEHHEKNH